MKIIFLISFLNIIYIESYSQKLPFADGFYMPYKYLQTLKIRDFENKENLELLTPIRGILIKGNKIYAENWGSDYLGTRYNIRPNNELSLNDVPLNFDYQTLVEYHKFKYSIIKLNNKMMLLVKKPTKTDSIVFDRFLFDSIPIKSSDGVIFQAKLINNFDLYNQKDELIEKGIKILANGKVINSKFINRLDLTGGNFALRKDEINDLIPIPIDSGNLEHKKVYLPELGMCSIGNITQSDNVQIKNCRLRFIKDEIYVYEYEYYQKPPFGKLKRFLYKLKS